MKARMVNPAKVIVGDKIATKYFQSSGGDYTIVRSRQVKRAGPCPGDATKYHIDHECYDTRFSAVILVGGSDS